MPAEINKEIQLEIAHVLFIDIVGYSKLLINEEHELLQELNQIVRTTEAFRAAEAVGKLIRLPTGDGMALAFASTPEAPVQCALEISKALKSHPELRVRMGIHSGPVSGLVDVNDRSNIAGAGINVAQRVMDCGDAGHILLSRHIAEDLEQYRQWQPHLHDLGECEVKHGVHVHVVNFYTEELGNQEVPEKLQQAKETQTAPPAIPASDAKPAGRSRAWIVALIIVAAAAAAGFYIYSHRSSSEAPLSSAAPAVPIIPEKSNAAPLQPAVPEKSIAVLPFLDLSQAKDQEYFCDGISEEILDALAKVDGLRVVARTSSFSFKGNSVDVSDVRKKLNVENVLEGSLRREGNRVRITAQLINTRSGFHLWSETYERELQGVFALQDEITRSIVDALKIKLAVSLPAHEQRSTEAYDLYLQGLYFSNKGSEEDLRTALNFFQSALDKDPKFSRAWTGIAKVWFFLADVYVKPLEAYPASKAAALKAIALDEKDAEAHCYLGEAKRVLDWDLAGEDAELKRALQLDPNSAPAHFFSALLPLFRGELKEGLRLVLEAEALDPLSPITSYVATAAYLANDQIDEAIMEGQRTLQLDPNYFYLDSNLAAAYREKGNFAEAIALYTKAQEATPSRAAALPLPTRGWAGKPRRGIFSLSS